MTYPLKTIMDAICVRLGAVLPEDMADSTTDPTWHFGRRWIFENARRPPSYVWWPGDITPAGPFKGDLGQYIAVEGGIEVVNVHSWGGDEEATWELRHNLIAAAKGERQADCRYLGCQWFEPNDQGFGAGFVTRLAFSIPVIDEILAVVVPTGYQNTAYIMVNGVQTLVVQDTQVP